MFSFGRDHGHYGRILNQTVVSIPSLNIRNGNELRKIEDKLMKIIWNES